MEAVQRLRDLVAVFLALDTVTAREGVTVVDLTSQQQVKRFTQSFVRHTSSFHTLLLGLTAGLKEGEVVRFFAEYWQQQTHKQHFELDWAEFVALLRQLSHPEALGRLKVMESCFTLLRIKAPNKANFQSAGLDSHMGYSVLELLQQEVMGPHNRVKLLVSAS